jgi:hypothetical protein
MKIHWAEQGTQAWLDARLGLPTASCFDQIITPSKLKLSEQRHRYKHRLLAEWLTGVSCDETPTAVMDRGTELEPKARQWYEITAGVDVQQVGLCLTDDGLVGASPDGLVGDDGGLEIKCPMMPGYLAYLLGWNEAIVAHRMQVQGCLYVTGRKWWDVVIYNPKFGGMVNRIEPDPETQDAISFCLRLFIDELNLAKEYLLDKGLAPFSQKAGAL